MAWANNWRKYYWCPTKCEKIIMLSYYFFQYYNDGNIWFSLHIAPCKGIALNLLICFILGSISLLHFLFYSYRSNRNLIAIAFLDWKRATTIGIAIVGRAITIEREIKERRLRTITLLGAIEKSLILQSQYWKKEKLDSTKLISYFTIIF